MSYAFRADAYGQRHWEAAPAQLRRCPPDYALDEPEEPELYARVRRGLASGEALNPHDRRLLVTSLWEIGWADIRIAAHTRMPVAVTTRLREDLGLAVHYPRIAPD